jgi:two-component system sensor histidine kinase HydH
MRPVLSDPRDTAAALTPRGILRLDGCYVVSAPTIREAGPRRFSWLDALWLLFLVGLALLPPRGEWHKQVILGAIGIVQLLEGRLIGHLPKRGPAYVVLLKILLAAILIDHTAQVGINSSYYPIFYLPIVTAALYFGPWMTLLWTTLASAAYCSYLYPALEEYDLTAAGFEDLALRIMFFFMAAMLVNRFAEESRRQTKLYQQLAEQLAETNRQLIQAQAEARRSERLAALGQLSAGLAHEIRNPLGVIKGSAEMLTQKLEGGNELARELAGYISIEVNRLSALVTQFLNFARPLHADPHPADLTALLDRVLKNVSEQWKGKPVQIQRAYASDLPLVPVDEGLCEQAFINLVQNAHEAMEEDGGTLGVEVGTAVQDKEGVFVRFMDSGPGVPDTMREEIFNPFVTTKKTGVGLGLSIVSQIVDGHHGTIRVEKGPQGGASFIIYFPLEQSSAAQPEDWPATAGRTAEHRSVAQTE